MAWDGVDEAAVKNTYPGPGKGYRGARAQLRGILGIAPKQRKRKKLLDEKGYVQDRSRQLITRGQFAGRPFGDD
jgi:hypothetical protein